MNPLAALMDYVDAQKGALDWPAFLQELAENYRSTAGLFYHEFGDVQQGAMLDTIGISDEYIKKYKQLAPTNPWLPFLLSRPTGFFIWGGAVNPVDRMTNDPRSAPFVTGWLAPQNLLRGIGAVLLKDKETFSPNWAMAIALLRSDGEPGIGQFDEAERERFQSMIPFMLRHIEEHPFIESRFNKDRKATIWYINPAKTGDSVPKSDDNQNDVGGFLDRLGIVEPLRRSLLAELIEAGQRGDDALLNAVRRTVEAYRASTAPQARPDAPDEANGRPGNALPSIPDMPPPHPVTGEPQYYENRPTDPETGKRETIDKFLERVWYEPWIKDGLLTRVALNRVDQQAATALKNFLMTDELPEKLQSLLQSTRHNPRRPRQELTPEARREAQRMLGQHYRGQGRSR